MSSGLYVGFTGAVAAKMQLEVIANNVANVSTTGFRRDELRFDTIVEAATSYAGAPVTVIDQSSGSHRQTGNALNAALDGDSFFVVQGPEGQEFYTRRGDFQLSRQGELVLPGGLIVSGQGGALVVPSDLRGQLTSDGTLMTEKGAVGRLRVVRFDDPEQLSKAGTSLLSATEAAGVQDVNSPHMAVGYVEQSNVNIAAEMVALIQTTRAFESAMRLITAQDELTQRLIQSQTP